MIAAQIISIVAFLVSWIWWVTFVIGLAATISLQVVWCVRRNRCGLFALAGVSAFAGATSFIAGIYMLVAWKNSTYCRAFSLQTFKFNDDYINYTVSSDYCNEGGYAMMAFVTGILWFAATGCILYFVTSGRHAKCEEDDTNNNNNGEGATATATATAIEIGSVQLQQQTASTSIASASTSTSGGGGCSVAIATATIPTTDVAAAAAIPTADAYVLPEPNKFDTV